MPPVQNKNQSATAGCMVYNEGVLSLFYAASELYEPVCHFHLLPKMISVITWNNQQDANDSSTTHKAVFPLPGFGWVCEAPDNFLIPRWSFSD